MAFDLLAFMEEHYNFHNEDEKSWLTCKQCGKVVSYVTKHAAVRHGVDVEVIPVADGNKMAEAY